jgi:proline iminopeptidase
MRVLYEPIEPFAVDRIATGDGHSIYVEQAGNPAGIPVLFLHGGPGSGCNENHRRYFHPAKWRVILFDQRGCNRSTPAGETRNNTTPLLLQDMEAIRARAGIGKWVLFGGSWGATLALLYAQANAARVLGLVLRGVFLARQRDLDWFARDGANRIFPDEWARFVEAMAPVERQDPVTACIGHVLGDDAAMRRRHALAWSRWSTQVTTYLLGEAPAADQDEETLVCQARIEMHYARNRYFVSENQILDQSAKLPAVPIRLIHGRRDLTCTLDSSWSLRQRLPGAELVIVREGGHLASEPVMVDALVRATDALAEALG